MSALKESLDDGDAMSDSRQRTEVFHDNSCDDNTEGNGLSAFGGIPDRHSHHQPLPGCSSTNSKLAFSVDTSRIQSVPTDEQNSELLNLGLQVFNQDDFEQGVVAQVDEEIAAQERARAVHMLQKEISDIDADVKLCEDELRRTEKVVSMMGNERLLSKEAQRQLRSVRSQQETKLRQLKRLTARKKNAKQRLDAIMEDSSTVSGRAAENVRSLEDLLGLTAGTGRETESDRMIRLGEMTPFGTMVSNPSGADSVGVEPSKAVKASPKMSDFDSFLLAQDEKMLANRGKQYRKRKAHEESAKPGGSTDAKRLKLGSLENDKGQTKVLVPLLGKNATPKPSKKTEKSSKRISVDGCRKPSEFKVPVSGGDSGNDDSDGSWIPDDDELDDHKDESSEISGKRRKRTDRQLDLGEPHGNAKRRKNKGDTLLLDDGDDKVFQERLKRHNLESSLAADDESGSDAEFEGGFQVPGRIWNKLYRYQKTGVRWLWELHCQQAGGILGDEMGLGKTIQLICFLAGLRHSKLKDQGSVSRYVGLGPTLIVCPATVMHQWVKEIHIWWPAIRVAVLHPSGTSNLPETSLVQRIARSSGVLVTGYATVVGKQSILLKYDWHYVILDEGHKIRNPDAQVTVVCKQFRTCHRLILSGSPMQNNLKELWSLFDFVFPGKLGTLPDFMQHFSVPIVQGGYANASNIQVQTAYRCACVLRDTIAPYLLRRMKSDVKVALQLPNKDEQVLFCRLTQHQRDVYKEYLESKECRQILDDKFMVFPGLITLRKICNHPDLSTGGPKVFGEEAESSAADDEEMEFGYWRRSGKMMVVEALLDIWKKQGHKVLLFTQSRQMLEILERFVQQRNYSYLRMDGGTTISTRQPLVEQFNTESSVFLFLLTTRVGGLGINLTGADRIIIFDPDWNPSTDTQARERAWRIGQTRQVTIYRLLTTGTIEEKIYHRQIFKQFLTNRVLKDPKQRRFFKSNELYELFTLGDDDPEGGTETSAIFAGTNSDIKVPKRQKKTKTKKNLFDALHEKQQELGLNLKNAEVDVDAEDDKRAIQMRDLAKVISQKILLKSTDTASDVGDGNPSEKKNEIQENQAGHSSERKKSEGGDLNGDIANKSKLSASRGTMQRSSKKSKRAKKKRHFVDGEQINYIDRAATYKQDNEEPKEGQSKEHDDYVLRKLLKKSGSVHSAMLHDKIMMSSNPDYLLVENEAAQVAKRAAQALKESRSRCRQTGSLGVPTWTGQSGMAGAPLPSARPRFGMKKNSSLQVNPGKANSTTSSDAKPMNSVDSAVTFDGTALLASNPRTKTMLSSKELLTRIVTRSDVIRVEAGQNSSADGFDSRVVSPLIAPPSSDELELLTEIRNFVACEAAIDGQATTEEIVERFRSKLPHSKTALFKAMLGQIADHFQANGSGVWRLRSEFR